MTFNISSIHCLDDDLTLQSQCSTRFGRFTKKKRGFLGIFCFLFAVSDS